MISRHVLWAAVAATALTACGGDSSDSPAPAPAPAPSPAPIPVAGDRIEPLDTARFPRNAEVKAMQAAVKHVPAGAPVSRVALGALASVKAAAEAKGEVKGVALKVGDGREVPETSQVVDTAALLHWSPMPDGTKVAAISFVSEGARAIRLGVLADQIPAGAVLRFYGMEGDEVVEMSSTQLADMRRINEQGGVTGDIARMVWGPDTAGDVSTLEVQVPAGVDPAELRIAVPRISHLAAPAEDAWMRKSVEAIGDAASCHQDIMCKPELEAESRSVAKTLYTSSADGRSYMCTGTLLNDPRSSGTPNFLTAAHCISDQATASSLVTYWFFHAAACNSSPRYNSGATRIGGGAQLLFANGRIDSTLLRLTAQPPANVLYAGSYFGGDVFPGLNTVGIHHPMGDLQKFSLGQVGGYAICNGSSCDTADIDTGLQLRVTWQSGSTQRGSSGSALFAQSGNSRYVVGTLWGGNASCEAPNGSDYYGRFQKAFEAGIKDWLK